MAIGANSLTSAINDLERALANTNDLVELIAEHWSRVRTEWGNSIPSSSPPESSNDIAFRLWAIDSVNSKTLLLVCDQLFVPRFWSSRKADHNQQWLKSRLQSLAKRWERPPSVVAFALGIDVISNRRCLDVLHRFINEHPDDSRLQNLLRNMAIKASQHSSSLPTSRRRGRPASNGATLLQATFDSMYPDLWASVVAPKKQGDTDPHTNEDTHRHETPPVEEQGRRDVQESDKMSSAKDQEEELGEAADGAMCQPDETPGQDGTHASMENVTLRPAGRTKQPLAMPPPVEQPDPRDGSDVTPETSRRAPAPGPPCFSDDSDLEDNDASKLQTEPGDGAKARSPDHEEPPLLGPGAADDDDVQDAADDHGDSDDDGMPVLDASDHLADNASDNEDISMLDVRTGHRPWTPDLQPLPPPAKRQKIDPVPKSADTTINLEEAQQEEPKKGLHFQQVQLAGRLASLRPATFVNDGVIDNILALAVSLYPTTGMLVDSLLIKDTVALPPRLVANFKKLRPSMTLAAVNYPKGQHWTLVVLTPDKTMIYDSYTLSDNDAVAPPVEHLSAQLQLPDSSHRTVQRVRCTQQSNGTDCGVATLVHALLYITQREPARPASESAEMTGMWLGLWRKIFLALLSPEGTVSLEEQDKPMGDSEVHISRPPSQMSAAAFQRWCEEEQSRVRSVVEEGRRARRTAIQGLYREAQQLIEALLDLGEIHQPRPTNVISRALSYHESALQLLTDSGQCDQQTADDIRARIAQLEQTRQTRERAREMFRRVLCVLSQCIREDVDAT